MILFQPTAISHCQTIYPTATATTTPQAKPIITTQPKAKYRRHLYQAIQKI